MKSGPPPRAAAPRAAAPRATHGLRSQRTTNAILRSLPRLAVIRSLSRLVILTQLILLRVRFFVVAWPVYLAWKFSTLENLPF